MHSIAFTHAYMSIYLSFVLFPIKSMCQYCANNIEGIHTRKLAMLVVAQHSLKVSPTDRKCAYARDEIGVEERTFSRSFHSWYIRPWPWDDTFVHEAPAYYATRCLERLGGAVLWSSWVYWPCIDPCIDVSPRWIIKFIQGGIRRSSLNGLAS